MMQVELSTINVLLGLVITMQVWIVRELFSLRTKLAVVISHCPHCQIKLNE